MSERLYEPFVTEDHDHQACLDGALAAAEDICHRKGCRFTEMRRKVFKLVWRQHKPVGAYQILEMLQREGRAAPPTVYRALDFLQDVGLVHRIASLNAYVGCCEPGKLHDGQFLICEVCHALAELDSPAVTAAIEESAQSLDFEVRRNTVEILGLCPACRRKGRS
jgi:Fur family zinc uptake transcriptional regulator